MNPEFFEKEVYAHRGKVLRLAKHLLKSKEEAEDVTQEVMVKLWLKEPILKTLSNIEAYLLKTTKNHCLNYLKKARVSRVSFDKANYDLLSIEPIEDDDTCGERLREVLNQLPAKYKLVFHLRDLEGYSFQHISQVTGYTEANIRMILSRARRKLRLIYKNILKDGEAN